MQKIAKVRGQIGQIGQIDARFKSILSCAAEMTNPNASLESCAILLRVAGSLLCYLITVQIRGKCIHGVGQNMLLPFIWLCSFEPRSSTSCQGLLTIGPSSA